MPDFLFALWLLLITIKIFELDGRIKTLEKREVYPHKTYQSIRADEDEVYNDYEEIGHTGSKRTVDTVKNEETSTYNEISSEEGNENEYCGKYDETAYEAAAENTKNKRRSHINPPKEDNSVEALFLGNIFSLVGAFALIVCCIIFIKLIAPFIIFTPFMKVLLMILAGTGMITGGFAIKKPSLEKYAEIMIGTGFTVLFITVFCMTSVFNMVSPVLGSVLGGLLLICAFFISDKRKTYSMLGAALFGGYFNIISLSKSLDTVFILGYLIFLNMLSLIYTYRNRDKSPVNIINLLITLIYLWVSGITRDMNFIFPCLLWSIYLIYDMISKNNKSDTSEQSILNWANFMALTLFSILIFRDNFVNIGYMLLYSSTVYFFIIAYYVFKDSIESRRYMQSFILSVLLATFFLFSGTARVVIWSLEALLLSFAAQRLQLNYAIKWILLAYTAVIAGLLLLPGVVLAENTYTPVLNDRLRMFAAPFISMAVSYFLCISSKNKEFLKLAEILKLTAVSLVYLFVSLEINNYFDFANEPNSSDGASFFTKLMIYGIIGFIYSIQINKMNETARIKFFDVLQVFINVVSSVIILIFGFHYSPAGKFIPIANVRFTAYLTAIISMLINAKKSNHEIYKYLAIIFGFTLITAETLDYTGNSYLISVMWLLYAGAITAAGIYKNEKYLKTAGIIISILAAAKIIFIDTINLELWYKLIVYLTLGTIFMIISYYYNKKK